jgi:hypothetical protein
VLPRTPRGLPQEQSSLPKGRRHLITAERDALSASERNLVCNLRLASRAHLPQYRSPVSPAFDVRDHTQRL